MKKRDHAHIHVGDSPNSMLDVIYSWTQEIQKKNDNHQQQKQTNNKEL